MKKASNAKSPSAPIGKRHSDQSFDDRAEHLNKNIYGSDKGRLRLAVLQRDLTPVITEANDCLSVLDAGCGAGIMSEWALSHGHCVVACDSAKVMLAEAKTRLSGYSNITFCHDTIQHLPATQQYDVIFCHAVLEWVHDQSTILVKLIALLKPNGTLSLMFYNAWAREMAQMVYGNFAYIERDYQVHQRVKLSPHWPAFPDDIEQQLHEYGLTVNTRSGIRVFYDIMRDQSHHQCLSQEIMHHELRVSSNIRIGKWGVMSIF